MEMGLIDVWRMHNTDTKMYSCQSASVGGLSWIDLGLGNEHVAISRFLTIPHKTDLGSLPALD